MAKAQKRSNREIRKPKATKAKAPVALPAGAANPVKAAMREPKTRP